MLGKEAYTGPSDGGTQFGRGKVMDRKSEWATIGELEEGLRLGHALISINRHFGQEGTACAQALAELLLERGVLTPEELEERIASHREELAKSPEIKLSKGPDKYGCEQVDIDCRPRLHLCRAACCTFKLFLSVQDLDEGVVKWDYGHPYWIRQSADGYCIHNEPDTLVCEIHQYRPVTCRLYDCRQDKRIWIDFEGLVPNPDLAQLARIPIERIEGQTGSEG
jgi:Fe-S-cluster containining protein